nr:WD repeat-containing protein 1 isoform X4 [Chrysemys picta bellii]
MPFESKKVFASLPQVERGVSKIIGGDPKGNNFLYTNGKCVVIRNIDNPAIADIYTEHAHQVVVAKYAPSGFYIASGDVSGKLRIWDTTQKEHLLKYEYQPFAGKIKDIAWTEDSKRLAAVGEGREKFGAVFLWDTGSSVGEISGHNKVINSVDIKQTRPYRIVTGSDDNCGAFFEGPPFKFKFTISIFVYDGKTGEKICALGGNKAHDGGIYAGHSKSIQCLTVHKNGGKSYIYSGSHDGHINYWDSETGENDDFSGKGHTNQVSRMAVDELDQLVSCSMDDTVRYTSLTKRDYSGQDVIKMDVQPKCLAVGPGGYTVVICIGQIILMKNRKKCFAIDDPGYEPEVVAIHPGGATAAVGGQDGNVHLYSIQGTSLKIDEKTLQAKGPVTDLAYSHDGAFLAVCDANKVVTVFSVADGYAEHNIFYGHHAKIVCLAWSPDNEHFASGGMDMMVYVWTLSDPETRVKIPDAHRLHHVSSLAWLDEHTLVTTSHDASVKEWSISYK